MAELQRAETNPPQVEYRMTRRRQHPANQVVPTLAHFQLKPGRAVFLPQLGHPGRPGRPVGEVHALAKPFERLVSDRPLDPGPVYFRHSEPGMRQPVGEFTIIGQEQEPLAVPVQPADGIHPLFHIRNQFEDGWAMPGVMSRGQEAFRFV